MSKHTPGPWMKDDDGDRVVDLAYFIVAEVDGVDEAEVEANARLIAAAPDMLEALREVFAAHPNHTWLPGLSARERLAFRQVKAAIAKAEGRDE